MALFLYTNTQSNHLDFSRLVLTRNRKQNAGNRKLYKSSFKYQLFFWPYFEILIFCYNFLIIIVVVVYVWTTDNNSIVRHRNERSKILFKTCLMYLYMYSHQIGDELVVHLIISYKDRNLRYLYIWCKLTKTLIV